MRTPNTRKHGYPTTRPTDEIIVTGRKESYAKDKARWYTKHPPIDDRPIQHRKMAAAEDMEFYNGKQRS